MSTIKKAVDYAFNNDINNMKSSIESSLTDKIMQALEQRKIELSQNIIKTNESVEEIDEKLDVDDDVKEWIDDFIKSNAPQFEGKSKKERIKMALAAYYSAKKKSTDDEIDESNPSYGLSDKQKSNVVKKAREGQDIGKKGKAFQKIVKSAKKYGADDPEAVAAAAMWKNIKR